MEFIHSRCWQGKFQYLSPFAPCRRGRTSIDYFYSLHSRTIIAEFWNATHSIPSRPQRWVMTNLSAQKPSSGRHAVPCLAQTCDGVRFSVLPVILTHAFDQVMKCLVSREQGVMDRSFLWSSTSRESGMLQEAADLRQVLTSP